MANAKVPPISHYEAVEEGSRMIQGQGSHFLDGEADSWFRRNLQIEPFDDEISFVESEIIGIVGAHLKDIGLPLVEVGASRGDRGYRISCALGLSGIAIEPSGEAIEAGREMFGQRIEFIRGLATEMPIPDKSVGLVFSPFVYI